MPLISRLTRIKQFAIKEELVPGTAETLLAAHIPTTFQELSSKYDREMHERNQLRRHLGSTPPIAGKSTGELTGKMELAPAATGAPPSDLILKAFGLEQLPVMTISTAGVTGTFIPGEQITSGSKEARFIRVDSDVITYMLVGAVDFVDTEEITGTTSGADGTANEAPAAAGYGYRPQSESSLVEHPAFTAMVNDDGIATEIFGAMGTGTLAAGGPGQVGYLDFTLSGTAVKPVDAILATATTYVVPVPETFLSGQVMIGTDSVCIQSLSFDIGNSVEAQECANSATGIKRFLITDRKPTIAVDPQAFLESDIPMFAKYDGVTPMSFYAQIGSSVGKRVAIVAPNCTLAEIPYGDRGGRLTYGTKLIPNADQPDGDDEYLIAFF